MATKRIDPDAAPPDELGHFKHHFSITMEIEQHPFFMLMAGAAVIIFLVYLYGKLRGAGTTSTTPSTTSTQQPFILPGASTTNTVPLPTPLPVTTSTPGNIRTKIANSAYDKSHAGVPFYTSPGVGNGIAPFGAAINIIGSAVTGPDHSNGGQYLPISYNGSNGFVATQDIA